MEVLKKPLYALLGLCVGLSTGYYVNTVSALTLSEKTLIKAEQEYADKFTGFYYPVYDGPIKVFTYEKLCKGFYTVEDNGVDITYTGFGDLADQYTFKQKSYKVDTTLLSTTTPDKNENNKDIPLSSTTPTSTNPGN